MSFQIFAMEMVREVLVSQIQFAFELYVRIDTITYLEHEHRAYSNLNTP